ncbi:hypothetical protein E6A53_03035, partial [Brachyspira hampsonii]|nr:hypothetical protein [Brachyspira hampsonii]
MKNFISIIASIILITAIISCGSGNKETEQTENTQTNKTETNKVYINPTTTNENHNTDIDINKTNYTNEYIQGTELDPIATGYSKIDEI